MKVKIWSDVRCPFCYIGKHKFEAALEQFPNRDQIEVEWRSFELDPHLKTDPGVSTLDHLAAVKGIDRDQVDQMTQYSVQAAREVGLEMDFQNSVVANSFNAHRLIQFAKTKGMGNEIEEQLFKAHFSDGQNIGDQDVLASIGVAIGLDETDVREVLSTDAFTREVKQDQAEAQSLAIRGVPFFVFNDKYGVSGAQPVETFLGALQQSWTDYEDSNKPVMFEEGPSCSVDGECL